MRTPGNVMPLTPAESELICLLTWQSFDWLLHFLTTASAQQLKEFVAEPEKWQANLPGTAIFARDAVPVYLHAATGKLLVSAERLEALSERRAALAYAKKGGLARPAVQEVRARIVLSSWCFVVVLTHQICQARFAVGKKPW